MWRAGATGVALHGGQALGPKCSLSPLDEECRRCGTIMVAVATKRPSAIEDHVGCGDSYSAHGQMENADARESIPIVYRCLVGRKHQLGLRLAASEIPHIPETVREVSDNLNRVQPWILQILPQAR